MSGEQSQSRDKGQGRAVDSPDVPKASASQQGQGSAIAQGGPFGTIEAFGPYFPTSSPAAMSAPSTRGGPSSSFNPQAPYFMASSPAAISAPRPHGDASVAHGQPRWAPAGVEQSSGHARNLAAFETAFPFARVHQPHQFVYPQPNLATFTHGPTGGVSSSIGGPSNLPFANNIPSASSIPSTTQGPAPLAALPRLTAEDGLFFRDANLALAHFSRPEWMPISESYGVPREGFPQDSVRCIKKVYNSLINLDNVKDATTSPEDVAKFRPGGDWSDERDLEAAATSIVSVMVSLHPKGQLESPLWLPVKYRDATTEDLTFTFHQRLHWVCFLVAHWKSFANRFMCQIALEAHVARIWSLVCMQPGFLQWWESISDEERQDWMEIQPYQHMTCFGFPLAHQTTFSTGIVSGGPTMAPGNMPIVQPGEQAAMEALIPADLEMELEEQGLIPSGDDLQEELDIEAVRNILGLPQESHDGQLDNDPALEEEREGA